jgi:hypothetical protein
MILKKSNLFFLIIFVTAQASENLERFTKYKNYIIALSALTATAAIVIPMYLKSRESTLDGIKIFKKSTKEALSNFRSSGNLYPILSIEDSIIPNILQDYLNYPKKNQALLKSFLNFKQQAQNFKYNLHQNNQEIIKRIKTIHSTLPEDVNKLIGPEIESFLVNPKIMSKTSFKINTCEKKLLSEINR